MVGWAVGYGAPESDSSAYRLRCVTAVKRSRGVPQHVQVNEHLCLGEVLRRRSEEQKAGGLVGWCSTPDAVESRSGVDARAAARLHFVAHDGVDGDAAVARAGADLPVNGMHLEGTDTNSSGDITHSADTPQHSQGRRLRRGRE